MTANGQVSAWRIGWASAKANAVPMVVLWCLAAATVAAYYLVPGVAAVFEPLMRWQVESGWVAAFLNRFVFAGLLPGVFMLSLPHLRAPVCPVVSVFAIGVWCGAWGIATDVFFHLQAIWFGDGPELTVVLAKTAVDQFVWNVLLVTPSVATFYFWIACGYSFARMRRDWPKHWIRGVILPNLLANWCVWIPVVAAVYAFPRPLQIQVSGFATAFWVLMCLKIGALSRPATNDAE